jgi:hypothetical protein
MVMRANDKRGSLQKPGLNLLKWIDLQQRRLKTERKEGYALTPVERDDILCGFDAYQPHAII